MTTAIILAAGESRRMGSPKLLLDIGGRRMIEIVAGNVLQSSVSKVIVVLGAYSDEIKQALRSYKVDFCLNENYLSGMLSSVKCGLSHMPGNTDSCLVFQGDQPFITTSLINNVISEYRSSGSGIVIPLCKGRRGHPLMFSARYAGVVEKLGNEEGLRALPQRFPADVHEFETGDTGILRDIDTYEDYLTEIKTQTNYGREHHI